VRAGYSHISFADRTVIRALKARKYSRAEMARMLGKHRSTICRELKRNTNQAGIYYEGHANAFMLARRRAAKALFRRIDRDPMLEAKIEGLLKRHYSPEQIAGYMRRAGYTYRTCHKTIYAWAHRKWQTRKAYLRFKGRPRVPYGQHKRLWQPHRRHISDRPRLVDRRLRVGDWEVDLVHGVRDDSRHSLLTLNERKSGFCIVRKLTTLNPIVVAHVIADALRELPVHTITCDNGFEFGQHRRIEKLVGCKVYFTDTHSPQQRGSNENLNGLLREFFPKGTSLIRVSQYDATVAATALNRRPRKRLGYECPRNVFAELTGASHYLVR
jgi:IS30 family transposase